MVPLERPGAAERQADFSPMMHRNKQRGFLEGPLLYAALGATALVLAMGGLLWLQTSRLDALQTEYDAFKGGVEALGKAAKVEADRKAKEDRTKKEQADAENAKTVADLNARIAGLRKQLSTSGGSMSPAPAGSRCPDGQTCFDRAEYQRADGVFVAGARSLSDEGAAVTADLDTAKRWARP